MGMAAVQGVHRMLANRPEKDFPGISAWVKKDGGQLASLDWSKPDSSWSKLDCEKLVTKNPDFWQMFYEVVPTDPALTMLHAGALMTAGDVLRAQVVLRLNFHRGDLPESAVQLHRSMLAHCSSFVTAPYALVEEGIHLHDKGDYAGALKKYDAALLLWPRAGWAAYERGTTFLVQQDTPAAANAFAQARALEPFQFKAWQGNRKEIPGMLEMLTEMSALWEKSQNSLNHVEDVEGLKKMSEILQLAKVDDLALVTRQVYIFRRGRYLPDDHPFISTSLRRLVPGPQAELTLKKLAGDGFVVTPLFDAPIRGKKKEEE